MFLDNNDVRNRYKWNQDLIVWLWLSFWCLVAQIKAKLKPYQIICRALQSYSFLLVDQYIQAVTICIKASVIYNKNILIVFFTVCDIYIGDDLKKGQNFL